MLPPQLPFELLQELRAAVDELHGLGAGELAQLGGRFHALHVPTLDDVDREELVHAPLSFIDNAHDRPDRAPADVRLM